MDKFAQDAFMKVMEMDRDTEFNAYRENVVENKKPIIEAVFVKLVREGKDPEGMAGKILRSGMGEDFAAFVATMMQICFHYGFMAGRKSMLEVEK